MKNIILLFFLASCATYIRTPATKMLSPEAEGGKGFEHGTIEGRFQSTTFNRLSFENDKTTNALKHSGSSSEVAIHGSASILDKFDAYVTPSATYSPQVLGLKYQLLGKTRMDAVKGSFSLSVAAGYGRSNLSQSSHKAGLFSSSDTNNERFRARLIHQDVGLIAGYRWEEKTLHYVNVYYMNDDLKGKASTDNNLDNAKFTYDQESILYSTGIIQYFGSHGHFKVDLSHLTSDWTRTKKTTLNTVSGAIGFGW